MRYDYKSPRMERDRDPVLSALLRQRGMVTYLAKELGISRSAVAQWYAIPDWHIPAISKILDIPQYQLRGEPGAATEGGGVMLYKSDLISEWGADTKKRQHLEDDLQENICTMLKWGLPADGTFWAVPNGGLRHKLESARMTRTGTRSGVPTFHIVYRGRLYCLELKSPTGQLSATQAQMIHKLADCGVPTAVIRKPEELVQVLREWNIPFSVRLS